MTALHGDARLRSVTFRSDDASEREVETLSMFVMVGAAPNTGWLDGVVDLDEKGYVPTGERARAAFTFA